MKNRINNKSGFTLIELIVVIAIIGILAAVLIPRFSGFSDKANTAVDFQNLATLNLTTSLYRNDHPEINLDGYEAGAVMAALVPDYIAEEMIATGDGANFAWVGDARKSWMLTTTGSDGQVEIVYTPGEYFLLSKNGTSRPGYIYGYDGRGGTNIAIPREINGVIITTIDQDAFNKKITTTLWDKLLSVILPDTISKISGNAFQSNNLTAIDIPDSVISIGANAFNGNKLEQVSLGNGLEEIKGGAFAGNKLTKIVLPDNLKTIGNGAFDKSTITEITIGGNVTLGDGNSLGTNGTKFNDYYRTIGKVAGTYIYEKGKWTLQ